MRRDIKAPFLERRGEGESHVSEPVVHSTSFDPLTLTDCTILPQRTASNLTNKISISPPVHSVMGSDNNIEKNASKWRRPTN